MSDDWTRRKARFEEISSKIAAVAGRITKDSPDGHEELIALLDVRRRLSTHGGDGAVWEAWQGATEPSVGTGALRPIKPRGDGTGMQSRLKGSRWEARCYCQDCRVREESRNAIASAILPPPILLPMVYRRRDCLVRAQLIAHATSYLSAYAPKIPYGTEERIAVLLKLPHPRRAVELAALVRSTQTDAERRKIIRAVLSHEARARRALPMRETQFDSFFESIRVYTTIEIIRPAQHNAHVQKYRHSHRPNKQQSISAKSFQIERILLHAHARHVRAVEHEAKKDPARVRADKQRWHRVKDRWRKLIPPAVIDPLGLTPGKKRNQNEQYYEAQRVDFDAAELRNAAQHWMTLTANVQNAKLPPVHRASHGPARPWAEAREAYFEYCDKHRLSNSSR